MKGMEPRDETLITEIQRIREQNNARWMDLVRLAFRSNPEEARRIMAEIVHGDEQVASKARLLAGE